MLTIIIGFIFWTMTLMLGYLIGEREIVNMSNLTKCKKDLFEMKSVVFKDISKQQSEKAQKENDSYN